MINTVKNKKIWILLNISLFLKAKSKSSSGFKITFRSFKLLGLIWKYIHHSLKLIQRNFLGQMFQTCGMCEWIEWNNNEKKFGE